MKNQNPTISNQSRNQETLTLVGTAPQLDSFDKHNFSGNEKRGAILPNAKSMGSRRQVDQGFGKQQGIGLGGIEQELVTDESLDLDRKFLEVFMTTLGELNLEYDHKKADSERIFSNGTQPFLSASAMADLNESTYWKERGNLASISSISQPAGLTSFEWYSWWETLSAKASSITDNTSSKAGVSKMNIWGEPALSKTIPALAPAESLTTDKGTTFFQGTNLALTSSDGKDFDLADANFIQKDYIKDIGYLIQVN